MQTTVFCKTKFEGVHCYPGAPDEVAYLRQPHRHMFGITVEIDVYGDDRELEFIMLKHKVDCWVRKHLNALGVWEMETLSCEQVAIQLIAHLSVEYCNKEYNRHIIVSVDEDDENGATVYGGPAYGD